MNIAPKGQIVTFSYAMQIVGLFLGNYFLYFQRLTRRHYKHFMPYQIHTVPLRVLTICYLSLQAEDE